SIIWEYLGRNIKCPQIKEYYKYKAPVGNSKYWVYCPTIDNTQKHRTNRGIVSKVYFDNQQGIKIEY
ncbi:MAG: hypothetical protein NZM44_01250, partial [Candidatus Calescibacterium sp.]|nr:hypothetical protein [Candidatus Calescibacterium sp.]